MYETTGDVRVLNPWTSIWTEPRATIRFLTRTNPTRHVLLLAALGGTMQSLSEAIDRNMGEQLSMPMILLLAAAIGSIFGVLSVLLGSYIVRWTGRWIGGRGSLIEIRTALGWANVPLVAALGLTLLMISVFGPLLFLHEDSQEWNTIGAGAGLLLLGYGLATIALGIWSFVVLLKGLGEVQGFSAWRAWGNLILCLLPIVGIGVAAAVLIPLLA